MNITRTGGALAALSIVAGLVVGAPARAQVAPPFTVLHQFTGGKDSEAPAADLTLGKDGALYGTSSGLYINESMISPGAVFKMTTAGAFTTLHTFSGSDGSNPQSNIVQDHLGNLYGTASYGGTNSSGTLFQITSAGVFNRLVDFDDFDTSRGFSPIGNLLLGKDGALYGTTTGGGPGGYGTLFRTTTAGALTTLVAFNFTHGSGPNGGLLEDAEGNFYGTTEAGGTGQSGTVFVYVPGFTYPAEYDFSPIDANDINSDGHSPRSGLVKDAAGNLYGTAVIGGAYGNGVIFEIAADATFHTLYNFTGGADGSEPLSKLTFGKDGLLYGTANRGGNGLGTVYGGFGTIFSIWPDGSHFTTLYSFSAADAGLHNKDGAFPYAGLTLGNDGNFYGSAFVGGINADGTIFKMTMLPVITTLSPASGPVGTKVALTGSNFTETLGVKIGNVSTPYTINSDKSLTITIPAGAKSGKITVHNSFGNGSSSKSFTVTP